MNGSRPRHLLALAGVAAAAGPTLAAEADRGGCVDTVVAARIVRQVPTAYPDCGDGCIVMRWPWFVELDVERVAEGEATIGRLTVLTLQHTYYVVGREPLLWSLRRNSLGTFNVIGFGASPQGLRCPPGASAAEPYIRPAPGRSLDDLFREGERIYGRRP